MRKLALVLFLLLAIQTWGVYGAWQARRVVYTCTVEIGPLCYSWEPSAIGKIVGASPSKDIEDALEKSRDAWDRQVANRLKKVDGRDFKKAADDVADKLGGALEKLGESAQEVIEKAKE